MREREGVRVRENLVQKLSGSGREEKVRERRNISKLEKEKKEVEGNMKLEKEKEKKKTERKRYEIRNGEREEENIKKCEIGL